MADFDLKLDVEEIRQDVVTRQPGEMVASSEVDPELDRKASELTDMLLGVDASDPEEKEARRQAVDMAGRVLQRQAAHRSRMLEQPVRILAARSEDGGEVARALIELKTQVEALDPEQIDLRAGWLSRLLARLPMLGSPIQRYFSRYESAQTVIDAIIRSLEQGRQQLSRDNATLTTDQTAMRELTGALEKQIELLMLIDRKLQAKLDSEIPADDPRHTFVSQELVFPLRQRIQDLQQQLVVNQQGILAMELVVRNNKELIRGVNRAIDVTIGALQVAVTVALALAHQKIVLNKITALNQTTSDLIASTASRLREQGTAIHQQSAGAMLDLDSLKSAFVDVHTALDEIARFRREALPQMAKTIGELDALTRQGEQTITQLEEGNRMAPRIQLEPS